MQYTKQLLIFDYGFFIIKQSLYFLALKSKEVTRKATEILVKISKRFFNK